MSATVKYLVGTSMAVLSLSCATAASDVVCPLRLLDKPEVLREESGWRAITKAEEKGLDYVGIYFQRPPDETLGAQVPDTTTTKRVQRDQWRLLRDPGDRYWLGCHYANTTAFLVRELGPEIQSCTVEYGLMPNGRLDKVRSVTCR